MNSMKLQNTLKVACGLLAAVLVTYLVGAAFISQGNLGALAGMGFEVTLPQRLAAIFHDISQMYDLFLPLVAIGLLVGFGVAAGIIHFAPHLQLLGYVSAGFLSMIALHLILKALLGLSGIAPTRELIGLLAQGLAGAVGGYVFHKVVSRKLKQESSLVHHAHQDKQS